MTLREQLYKELATLIHHAGYTVDPVSFAVPPTRDMGDIAVPMFAVARQKSVLPGQAAASLAAALAPLISGTSFQNVSAVGPYVNITLASGIVASRTLRAIDAEKDLFGARAGEHTSILFEYSQPNTHKAFHIGHLRNVLFGAALIQLYRSQGNTVTGVTYVNDVGAHVAQCLWGLQKFYKKAIPKKEQGRWLGLVYAHAAAALEKNPDHKKEIQEILKKLEHHDPALEKIWRKTRAWSLRGFDQIYKVLGVEFDVHYFESEVRDQGHKIVDELVERGIAKVSQGAVIVDLARFDLDVLVLRKSDGTGLYSTSDLGLAAAKLSVQWDESIVLTDVRQSLYFQQLFKILELFGIRRVQRHIGYEFVTLAEGNMSSRKGNVVLCEDFFDEVVEEAKKETSARHPQWRVATVSKTARAIALAAIKFSMLKVKPSQVIVFNKKEALSFEGFSGPYVLYMYARIQSILAKTKKRDTAREYHYDNVHEHALVMQLAQYPDVLHNARVTQDPSHVCKYLFELAQLFSTFYTHCQVLDVEDNIRAARVHLVSACAQVVSNGLGVLGITPISQM